jgi:hypothetical protein
MEPSWLGSLAHCDVHAKNSLASGSLAETVMDPVDYQDDADGLADKAISRGKQQNALIQRLLERLEKFA